MKQFLRSFLTLLMLVVWASGFAQEVTLDFTNAATDWKISTTANTKPTKFTNGIYTIEANKGLRIQDSGVLLGKEGATLTLPAFDFDVEKIIVRKNTGSVSGKVTQNIFVGTQAVSTETKGADKDQTYSIKEAFQKAGTIYVLKVTNGNNTQFSKIEIYKKASTKTLTSLAISGEPTKKTYNDGEAFDPTGLVVTGTYDDNTTATITNGITWATTPATLTVGTTSCSVTATVNGVTSPAYNVTGLTVTKTTAIVFDFTANSNAWGIKPQKNNSKDGSNVVAGKELKVSGVMMTATNGSEYGTCLYGTTSVTLNVYNGGSITFTAPEGYNISEIKFDNSKANFTTKEGNYANGIWVGNAHAVKFSNNDNKITIKTATIKLVATFQTLDESKDNTETISNNNGKAVDIKLTRTLVADKWNTFCVPFDTEIAGTALEGATVKAVGTIEGNVINLEDATKIEAGVPYLVKPTTGNIENPTFKSVTISVTTPIEKGNDEYKFVGTYSPKTINKGEFGKIWGVTAEGKLAKINAGTTMKGLRAYFVFPTTTAAAKLNFDGETTGINNIETNATVNGKVYNLNGQYVGNSLNGLKKGIYVVNGKKVIK